MTNAHVVAGESDTMIDEVGGAPGRRCSATAVLFDPRNDLAILRVPGLDAPALRAAASDAADGDARGDPRLPRGRAAGRRDRRGSA